MIVILIAAGFSLMGMYWCIRMIIVAHWRKSSKRGLPKKSNTPIFVLIPVLDEVARITQTTKYFSETFKHLSGLRLIIITTEKEVNIVKNPNTIDVVRELSEKYPILHVHYPKLDGKMAHQLNFAMKQLLKNPFAENALFAVYNADSKPHPKTFDWVLSQQSKKSTQVFQQYGDYRKNVMAFSGFSGFILTAASAWQTRWSIGFEMFNALKQKLFRNKLRAQKGRVLYPLNYCIGHGLFFTKNIFVKLHGFNEYAHNEDAIFGLELSYLAEPIAPIPYFDLSDTPSTVGSLFIQKSNWFFGPLQAFSYAAILQKKYNTNVLRIYALSTKLFSHAINWIVGPSIYASSIILTVINPNMFNILAVAAETIIFFAIPNIIAWNIASYENNIPAKNLLLKQIIGGPISYILHGLSAYRTIIRIALRTLFEIQIIKEKTK